MGGHDRHYKRYLIIMHLCVTNLTRTCLDRVSLLLNGFPHGQQNLSNCAGTVTLDLLVESHNGVSVHVQ